MRKPVVDYRGLRPATLTSPEYKHVLLLGGWIVYFILYFLTERFIPDSACHVIHCRLDDLIPFNEYFLIFYCSWYVLILGVLLNYLLYDVEKFKQLQSFIMLTQLLATIVYIVYPSVQQLRPESFERDNFFTALMTFIYNFDTPTGVCPSLHVSYTWGIVSTILKDRKLARWKRIFFLLLGIMICVSTAFVKQHSCVDIFFGLVLGLVVEVLVYGKTWWQPKLKTKLRTL